MSMIATGKSRTEHISPFSRGPNVDLIYLDESGDISWSASKGTRNFALSAIAVPEESWNEIFDKLKSYRKWLRDRYDIPMSKEIHARDFLNGRGRPSRSQIITKHVRVQIISTFVKNFSNFACRHGVYAINVCMPNRPGQNGYDLGVDRMLNRIERTLKARDRRGVLIFDEGKEHLIRRISRKMRVFNPVPSQYGSWGPSATKNITTDRLIGDPFFRNSGDDYFIQASDLLVYCVLKHFEPPTPHVAQYKINDIFTQYGPILYKGASKYHNLGVVTK